MFTEVPFIIINKQKQLKYPSTDEWGSNGILTSYQKQWSNDIYNRWAFKTIEWKKPVTKDYIWYDSIYMKCPEQANRRRQKIN